MDPKVGGKKFRRPFKFTSTNRIAAGHTIRIVDLTYVPVIPFHVVRAFAVVTELSFCW